MCFMHVLVQTKQKRLFKGFMKMVYWVKEVVEGCPLTSDVEIWNWKVSEKKTKTRSKQHFYKMQPLLVQHLQKSSG